MDRVDRDVPLSTLFHIYLHSHLQCVLGGQVLLHHIVQLLHLVRQLAQQALHVPHLALCALRLLRGVQIGQALREC